MHNSTDSLVVRGVGTFQGSGDHVIWSHAFERDGACREQVTMRLRARGHETI